MAPRYLMLIDWENIAIGLKQQVLKSGMPNARQMIHAFQCFRGHRGLISIDIYAFADWRANRWIQTHCHEINKRKDYHVVHVPKGENATDRAIVRTIDSTWQRPASERILILASGDGYFIPTVRKHLARNPDLETIILSIPSAVHKDWRDIKGVEIDDYVHWYEMCNPEY